MASFDGVAKQGKTQCAPIKSDGPTAKVQTGGRKSAGVQTEEMKKYGRNMARVKNQLGG